MAQVGYRQVGRTVTYWGTGRKPRPGIITALSSNGGVVLRVGHFGETHGNTVTGILERTSHSQTNVWSVK